MSNIGCGNPNLTDDEIGMVECCPNEGFENHYRSNAFVWKVCNDCGKVIKPCSLCDNNTCTCTKCPLGADRNVVVMDSDTNGGMIDFGYPFGLLDYIKEHERTDTTDNELIDGWLESVGLTEGGFYRITDGYETYRVYRVSRGLFVLDHPDGDMVIDLADTTVNAVFLVYKEK